MVSDIDGDDPATGWNSPIRGTVLQRVYSSTRFPGKLTAKNAATYSETYSKTKTCTAIVGHHGAVTAKMLPA